MMGLNSVNERIKLVIGNMEVESDRAINESERQLFTLAGWPEERDIGVYTSNSDRNPGRCYYGVYYGYKQSFICWVGARIPNYIMWCEEREREAPKPGSSQLEQRMDNLSFNQARMTTTLNSIINRLQRIENLLQEFLERNKEQK